MSGVYQNEEERIQDKLKQKTWNEVRANDSWAIFKIMSEFVNGYETMGRIGPCVSILVLQEQNQKINIIYLLKKSHTKFQKPATES